ncbi:Type IV secretory pathway ATPase VirB11/Archaellum biosynthesis ATPase [Halovenus aranensis]|uniref:Type IV secretory pathway ATPase VirB11/Archaellum biosynthesis ATPase n=1 Tax=Halovenus aranensis TaxID=890420 RepID=A0A1G8WQK0_9EURY|nr:type II/IV secretion system ATPase subunit [Halovenus aranensis]SDJ80649.1 Type IV secretory pathway ATPase VirB11/Archaellum biosynthesis ATPase [Halovenus aranensis]
MADASLELADPPGGDLGAETLVPPPLPPDDPEAWYADGVQAQDEIHPGVVVTLCKEDGEFEYRVREPVLTARDEDQLARIESHFADAHLERPRTREGAAEVMDEGFAHKHERVARRLVEGSAPSRRRITYHALASLACLGDLTPYALDDRIEVADAGESGIVVHTEKYAPAATSLPADPAFIERFASERIAQYTVSFHGFEIPVIRYRENVLGRDPFERKYAVREPDLLPGDEQLIEECKERLWETAVDGVIDDEVAFVRERAEAILSRRLHRRNTRAWVDALAYRVRSALAEYDLAVPPVERKYADDRLDDLVYYVLRDYVGYGQLTVPIRDPTLEDIEANRVGERIKVIPRDADAKRVPTNLRFEDEQAFVNVVTQLAASDGTELSSSTPSAKVNLSPPGVDETIRCAVALPTISEDGPHLSIRKQSTDVLTPVDLVNNGSLPTELVALLWLYYEHHGVVLFSGPTGAGKTTLMNAHMPFIGFEDRPISIDEGSREVELPHETGVSLTTRDHENEHKQVTMADLMTECNYLNPDVEVIAEVNTTASFETFAESINTGHGLIGTTHAGDIETLVNRVIEQELPPYLLREIDLVVFPRRINGDRYVGRVIELLDEHSFQQLDDAADCGRIEKSDTTIYWNTVLEHDESGTFNVAFAGNDASVSTFERLGHLTDRSPEAVRDEFRRKHRYVKHMVQEDIDDFDALFELLADLETNEAATVERLSRQAATRETREVDADR